MADTVTSPARPWNGKYECQDCGGLLMVECDYTGHSTLICEGLEDERPYLLAGTDPDREVNEQETTWGRVYCRDCGKYQPFEAQEDMGVAYLEHSDAMAERLVAERAEDEEEEESDD